VPQSSPLLNAAMLRWLDELSNQGIFATDADLVIRSWNRWLERNTGRSAEAAVGRKLFGLWPELPARGLDRYYHAALAGEVSLLAHRFHGYLLPMAPRIPSGPAQMPQSARIAPLLDGGQIIGTITVIEDVGERVNSEAELRRQIEASERARETAEEASRVKEEFLATLSHEIRTPLNAVLGWIKILRGRAVEPAMLAHALQVIDRNASAQALLIEDMLDMARVVTGKLRLEIGPVDLVAVTLAAIDVVSPAAAAKNITLRSSIAAVPTMRGDPDRVQQIVWNILSNAVKFTPSGGTVHVRVGSAAGSVFVSIEDTGEGIAPDFLPFVFERFRQATASVSRTHGGLGLGLALVRQLVEMQGGKVTVASPGLGRGATFTVAFPEMTGASVLAAPDEPEPADVECLAGVRVLVVDDEQDARDLTATALSQYGAIVSVVGTAKQALEILEDDQAPRPQLLIADISMPGQDGYRLIQHVRRMTGEVARIAAMAVTAYASEKDKQRALDAGFDLHIPKPITPTAIVMAVSQLLKGA
jgi:PAS domain S-box-containing protein